MPDTAFGLEKVCVSESPESFRFILYKEAKGEREYLVTKSGLSTWGKRRDTMYFETEATARVRWNRVRAGYDYEGEIAVEKDVDSCDP
jgi:hypothetical protein